MNKNAFQSNIRELREYFSLNRKEFSQKIGKNPQDITNYEKGNYSFTQDLITKIMNFVPELNVDWLLTGRGEMFHKDAQERKLIKIKSWKNAEASAGIGLELYEQGEEEVFEVPARFFRSKNPKNCIIFTIRGDSMEPRLQNGELALVDISDRDLRDGCVYLIRYEGRMLLKQIQQLNEGVELRSFNPTYKTRLLPKDGPELEILGRLAIGFDEF